jgi:hypothetical protein
VFKTRALPSIQMAATQGGYRILASHHVVLGGFDEEHLPSDPEMAATAGGYLTPAAKRCHVMFSGRFNQEHFMVLQNYILKSPMRYIHTSPSKLRCRLIGV